MLESTVWMVGVKTNGSSPMILFEFAIFNDLCAYQLD